MKISSIETGTKLNIQLTYKGERYEAESIVLTSYGKGIIITPVYCNGKIIEYCSDATFVITNAYTGISHKFLIDSLSRVDFSGADFHIISGRELVARTNQRKSPRIKVQKEATITLSDYRTIKLVVNDLSIRGMSILAGKNSDLFKIGDVIEVEFVKEGYFKHIRANCKVVRKFKIGEWDAIGCSLISVPTSLVDYIQFKKQQKLENKDSRMFEQAM